MSRSFFEESAKIVGLIKGKKNLLFASHIKRGEGKADRRLFLLTCVAQKRLCPLGIVCLVHVLRTWRCTMFNSIPVILIFLTNKNSSLIYSVIICEQKNKGQCTVRVFRMINSQLHCCFYQLWCLPSFATPDLLLTMLWLLVPYNHVKRSI